jgi:hypothetical protein
MNSDVPSEYICPITLNIMDNPVICDDGYTYEKDAILAIPNSMSPMTRQYINKNNLIPNRGLKDAIERYKSLNNLEKNLNNDTNLNNYTNPQLIYPSDNITEYLVRSPWDDKIYSIKYNQKETNWIDSRYSTTLIAVLDTSGSMGESCSLVGEQDGFSRLNLVQHSMNTVIQMLNPGDELILIEFNSTSNCIFNEKITVSNKPRAKSIIDSLVPGGGTYIWNGLQKAFECAIKSSNNNIHIMLLTDGQASDSPYNELKRYFELKQDQLAQLEKIKLTTFGFSYDINSKILFDLSEFTNSCFNFIPDASMVGTTFCNYLGNILSPDLFVCNIKHIESSPDINSESIISFESIENTYIRYELIRYHCYQILKNICIKSGSTRIIDSQSFNTIKQFEIWIKNIIQSTISPENYLNLLQNMLKDFVSDDDSQEQISKAISRSDWFNKWGYHYLLSLSLAHLSRQCHNFKDQGVQLYGSDLFQQIQSEAYQIFSSIQPPKPSLRAQVIRTSMSAYVNSSGGCFGPECKIKLANGSLIRLDNLIGNELVYQGEGNQGVKIKYIVKMDIDEGSKSMCLIDNLIISEYHPIFDLNSNEWVFPIQLTQSKEFEMNSMYNIVLESGYWVEIEGYKCVSLGHQLEHFDSTNKILKHDYFGTNKVIEDLEGFYNTSCLTQTIPKIIHLSDYLVLRDELTNLVMGIKQKF